MTEMPEVLRPLVPSVGSVWLWEPMSPHAWEVVRVTDVIWNGEEVMVESEPLKPSALVMADGPKVWNDFGRWIEATVLYRAEIIVLKCRRANHVTLWPAELAPLPTSCPCYVGPPDGIGQFLPEHRCGRELFDTGARLEVKEHEHA